MRKIVLVQDTGTVTLGASTVTEPAVLAKSLGAIVGFIEIYTGQVTSSSTSWKTASNMFSDFILEDASHNQICDLQTSDIPQTEFLLSALGIYPSDTAFATTATNITARFVLPLSIALKDQPVTAQIRFAPYTNGEGSATAGQSRSQLYAVYEDDATYMANAVTQRCSAFSVSIVSGLNQIAPQLAQGVLTNVLAYTVGTESHVTYTEFESTGGAEMEKLLVDSIIADDAVLTVSGHQTGLLPLRVSPFVATNATAFDIQGSASDTVRVLQFYQD